MARCGPFASGFSETLPDFDPSDLSAVDLRSPASSFLLVIKISLIH